MNHSAVSRWISKENVTIIKTSAAEDHLLDSAPPPPHQINSTTEEICKLESIMTEDYKAKEEPEDTELSGKA